jgi:predicted nucleic acid-binding Zn ribbon protein
VASSGLTPSTDLLGVVLGAVARDTGSASVLCPLWRQVVGETLAAVSKPHRWLGTTLVIHCASASWANELRGQGALLERLQSRLGKKTVQALVFES